MCISFEKSNANHNLISRRKRVYFSCILKSSLESSWFPVSINPFRTRLNINLLGKYPLSTISTTILAATAMSSALLRTNIALIIILYVSWLGKHSSPLLIVSNKCKAFSMSPSSNKYPIRTLYVWTLGSQPSLFILSKSFIARSIFPAWQRPRIKTV